MGSLFLAKFSEFEIEGHEHANDIDEHRKERTRKAYNPRKDGHFDCHFTMDEPIPFLRI